MKVPVLILLIVAIFGPALWWYQRLEGVRARYATECTQGQSTGSTAADISGGINSMKEQSALLLNWGLVGLGGVIALITTTGTHPFLGIRWLFLLLAPALSLLAGSLWAGLLFQRRVTFLGLNACRDTGTLNDLLLGQSDLLQYAIWLMAFFAVVCLGQIVLGVANPGEAKR